MSDRQHRGPRISLAFYNEFDPFAAEWLRQLLLAENIAPGVTT